MRVPVKNALQITNNNHFCLFLFSSYPKFNLHKVQWLLMKQI